MKKSQGVRKPRSKYVDSWGNVIRGYERTLLLGRFADSGRTPKVNDVEVAVCFADLRGFTSYVHSLQKVGQDNKVQHFLEDYFKVYPKAVLGHMWDLEPDKLDDEQSATNAELMKLAIPTSYKNLGDGMMIVWELQDASDMRIQGLATRSIVLIVEKIQELFQKLTTKLGPVEIDSYSRHVEKLAMGFGIARGHAWRLAFGHHSVADDYAGSIINLAARLQDIARPGGIVAQLAFSESLFDEYGKAGNGHIVNIEAPKGFGADSVQVWASNSVKFPKKTLKKLPKS